MQPQHWPGPSTPWTCCRASSLIASGRTTPSTPRRILKARPTLRSDSYTPPAYKELDPQMNSVQLYIVKESNDRLQLWMDASDVLKRAVMSSHQHYGIRFQASSMQLKIQSDASYLLCWTRTRSVLGGLHFLGTPELINGPIYCTSKIISCVVTSAAAEAQLGAAMIARILYVYDS